MRIVTIIVEVAAARLTEIPVSDQVRFPVESVRGPIETAEPDCSKKSTGRRVLNFARWRSRPQARCGRVAALRPGGLRRCGDAASQFMLAAVTTGLFATKSSRKVLGTKLYRRCSGIAPLVRAAALGPAPLKY
jgi:hypothetical protein